jgi:hypothetical protein
MLNLDKFLNSHNTASKCKFSVVIIRMIKSRKMEWVWHVARKGEMSNSYKTLTEKNEEKRLLWRPRHRWQDNIKMHIWGLRVDSVNWIHLTQDRDWWWALVRTVMNLHIPWKAGNFFTCWGTISFSERSLLHEVSYC